MKKLKSRGTTNVNVRKEPSTSSPIELVLKPGDELIFVEITSKEKDGTWLKTDKGWVRSDLVVISEPMKGKRVEVIRLMDTGKQIIGSLIVTENERLIFSCKTLELPWLDNQQSVSAIPTGEYKVEMTYSPAFKKNLYLIKDVPNRAGVRIHSANFASQLRGCIALGSNTKDINGDAQLDLIHSGRTMADFERLMENKPFTLTIKNSY